MLWAHDLTTDPQNGPLTPTEKLFLLMLALKHDEQTTFGYATVSWLADRVLVSERQIRRMCEDLQTRGLIRVEVKAQTQGQSGQRINRYYLPRVRTPASALPEIVGTPASPLSTDAGVPSRAIVRTPVSNSADAGVQTLNEERLKDSSGGVRPENEGGKSKRPSRTKPYVRPATPTWLLPFERAIEGLGGYAPTEAFFAEVDADYRPCLNITQEGVKLADWCRRKGAQASTTRILNWLKRAKDDHPGRDPEPAAAAPRPTFDPGQVILEPWPHWQECRSTLQRLLSAGNMAAYIDPILAARITDKRHLVLDVTPGLLMDVQRFRPLILKAAEPFGVVDVHAVLLD